MCTELGILRARKRVTLTPSIVAILWIVFDHFLLSQEILWAGSTFETRVIVAVAVLAMVVLSLACLAIPRKELFPATLIVTCSIAGLAYSIHWELGILAFGLFISGATVLVINYVLEWINYHRWEPLMSGVLVTIMLLLWHGMKIKGVEIPWWVLVTYFGFILFTSIVWLNKSLDHSN